MKGILLAAVAALSLAGPAGAVTIYDSGDGVENRAALDKNQWLAGYIELGSNATVDDLGAFLQVTHAGDLTFALLDGSGGAPGSVVDSATVTVGVGAPQWIDATSLGWNVAAGSYWMAFEAAPSSTAQANFFGSAPSPLNRYDFLPVGLGGWTNAGSLDLGIRLLGEGGDPVGLGPLASVPEPAAWTFMIGGFGLAGAALRRRARPYRAV